MEKGIRDLVVRLLDDEVTVQSWGITNIQIQDNAVKFIVSGFKYNGMVQISTNANGYKVSIETKSIQTTLENIVGVLDEIIEKTENYTTDLTQWINK